MVVQIVKMKLMFMIGLPLLILNVYFSIVVATTCENENTSIECESDEFCCETNGNLKCCPFSEYWWIWLIIGVCTVLPCVIVCVVFCCIFYCVYRHHKRSRTPAVVQQVRTIDLTPNNGSREDNLVKMQTYNPPYSSDNGTIDNTDAPPAYSDICDS